MTKAQPAIQPSQLLVLAIAIALTALISAPSHAQTFKVLYNFTSTDNAESPLAGFAIDASGNLYGTASAGGSSGAGSVFRITAAGKMRVLYSFKGGADGANPQASLKRGPNGGLYGTTSAGGAFGNGTVFKVTPEGVETVLYNFKGGADGADPQAGVFKDKEDNLYGTTFAGGASGAGTVFKVTKEGQETILHSFGSQGTNPVAGVTFDAAGNIYGTTSTGGHDGNGTVYQLAANSGWAETTLHDFALGTDGGVPYGGLIFDGSGNIYGATTEGGIAGSNGGGTIFELTPNGSSWTFSTLYVLPGSGISGSFRNLLLDSSGNLYATTHCDGAYSAGTVYKLTNSGGTWTYSELYTFTGGTDGLYSFSNLVADKLGNLYGTTKQGGQNGYGVVFKVTP